MTSPLLAACPRCDLPMVIEARRRVLRCSCCGTLTTRRRLIDLTPPQGQPVPCFDARCRSPRL